MYLHRALLRLCETFYILVCLINKYMNKINSHQEVTSALAGFHVSPQSWLNWNLEMLVFVAGGKPQSILEPTTNSTHIWHWVGIEPRPHWWEASVLTTTPSLLLKITCDWLDGRVMYPLTKGNILVLFSRRRTLLLVL